MEQDSTKRAPLPTGNRLDVDLWEANKYGTEVPGELKDAANGLAALAYQGWGEAWQDRSSIESIQAQRAAIRACVAALAEIEVILNYSIQQRKDDLLKDWNGLEVTA